MNYHTSAAVISVIAVVAILLLIRRDHLRIRYSIWWLFVAFVTLVLGMFPETINLMGRIFGVAYPPTLVLAIGIIGLLIKILTMDIEHSRQERTIRRLAQRLAMFEADQQVQQRHPTGHNFSPPD